MNAVTEVMDELRKALSEVDDIRASLRRKVRHCDELIEERDQMERERDEARERNTDLRKMLEQTARALNHAEEAMVRLETQRDEARAALATCPDCVMYAKRSARFAEQADQLQRERDEARADLREFVRQVENAYELLEPLEEGSDVVERAVGHLLTVLRGRERPGPWAFDAVLRERDEARANYQWMVNRACDEKLEGYRELGAKCAQLEEERDEARADAERYLADLRRCASEPYEHAKDRAEAFRRGAEAMREACAVRAQRYLGLLIVEGAKTAEAIRALPIPEEP